MLELLVPWALAAIPLVGVPVLLHLFNRRRSPVLRYSSLMLIRQSLQQTAARRKIQNLLLLLLRIALVILLVLLATQPVWRGSSSWANSGRSRFVVIVLDRSHSMFADGGGGRPIDRATDSIRDLLARDLAGARVVLLPSASTDAAGDGRALLAAGLRGVTPRTGEAPVSELVAAAIQLCQQQPEEDRWVLVASDFQAREFPAAIRCDDAVGVVLLRPEVGRLRNVGLGELRSRPSVALPGLRTTLMASLQGSAAEGVAVRVEESAVDNLDAGQVLGIVTATSAEGSRGVRVERQAGPTTRPESLVRFSIEGGDAMPYDDQAGVVLRAPRPKRVSVSAEGPAAVTTAIRLALDPAEGRIETWPLRLSSESGADSLVEVWQAWPSEARMAQLRSRVELGARLVVFLSPGLSPPTAQGQRAEAAKLLGVQWSASPATQSSHSLPAGLSGYVADASSADLADTLAASWARLWLDRVTPLRPGAGAVVRLRVRSERSSPLPSDWPLLYQWTLGRGRVFCWSATPDAAENNLATHPSFLPLLVRSCLGGEGDTLPAAAITGTAIPVADMGDIALVNTAGQIVESSIVSGERRTGPVWEPGLWAFRSGGKALGHVWFSLPFAESSLEYLPPGECVTSPRTPIVCPDAEGLRQRAGEATAPRPRWTPVIAVALAILLLESLVGAAKPKPQAHHHP